MSFHLFEENGHACPECSLTIRPCTMRQEDEWGGFDCTNYGICSKCIQTYYRARLQLQRVKELKGITES